MALVTPEDIVIEKEIRFRFSASNNEAKYEALIQGLWLARKLGVLVVQVYNHSHLIVSKSKVNTKLENNVR